MTILEMVQDILNDMDSDEVNSFADTIEATQIAQIIKTTYYELISRKDWPHCRKFTTFDSVGDSSKPTFLKLPDSITRVDAFNYDTAKATETRTRYEPMEYLYPDSFVALCNGRNIDDTEVDSITTFDGIKLPIYNDRSPRFYTSFDDEYIVLDSYDSAVESTVQGINTQVLAYVIPTWTASDTFTPDLPAEAFPLLLAEAKSISALKLNQEADQKAEQQAMRQNKIMSYRNVRVKGGVRYPNYGRRGGKMSDNRNYDLFGRRS
jgi:hypothetical protein